MSKFFGSESEIDESVVRTHEDHVNATAHAAPANENGGTSNEAFLNDYRNRKPYHYIENGSDGYYYWQYGATMEIEFEIMDEMAFTDPTPDYVVDVRVNGLSVVDKATGIAELQLGTMATLNAADFYTADETQELIGNLTESAVEAQIEAQDASRRASKLAVDIYNLIGQNPGASDSYTVANNIPFTMVLKKEQNDVTVNGTYFKDILCVDASDPKLIISMSLKDLPHEVPFTAIYNTEEDEPRLLAGLSCLPPLYLMEKVLPFIDKEFKVGTKHLRLDEDTDEDEDDKDNTERR